MRISQPSKYVKLLLDDLVTDICRVTVTRDIETEKFLICRGGNSNAYHTALADAMKKWDQVKQEIIDILDSVSTTKIE